MSNLRELHLHVSKNMEEANHCIPQTTVSQALLVPCARTLWGTKYQPCQLVRQQADQKTRLLILQLH